jgi:hypothetical protein
MSGRSDGRYSWWQQPPLRQSVQSVSPTVDVLIVLTHDGDEGSRFLCGLIGSVQAAMCRRGAAVAALWAGAACLAALALLLAVDLWGPPGWDSVRVIVYLAAGPAAVVAVGVAAGRAWARTPLAFYVARLIEARRPQLKNALITFVELYCDPAADPSMSVAVGRRAARVLAQDGPAEFLPPLSIRRPVTALVAAAALVGMVLWMSQGVLMRPWLASAQASLAGPLTAAPAAPGGVQGSHPVGPQDDSPAVAQAPRQDDPPAAGKAERPGEAGHAGGAPGSPPQAVGQVPRRDSAAGDGKGGDDQAEAGSQPGTGGPGAASQGNDLATRPAAAGDKGSGAGDSGGDAAGRPREGPGQDPTQGRDSPSSPLAAAPAAAGGAAGMRDRPETSGEASGGDAQGRPRQDVGGTQGSPTPRAKGAGGPGPAKRPPKSASGGPPLPERDPGEDFPQSALDSMRQTRRIMKDEDRRPRDGETNDAFLQRMGVGNADSKRFTAAWQQKPEAAAKGPAVTPGPRTTETIAGTAQGEVLRPGQGTEARPIAGPVAVPPDDRQGLVQGAQSRVSPRFRPAVAAYFEAVDRMAAGTADTDARK